ncbi:hypothetical protein A2165_03060 [Candidatus Curtissbacteria bacterium RBG_13_40_7]|uniref:Uncharacterized protein n=1 Tax=Candidatus Curtissbacteria bacterium RBG_13_40_7 TaxID=1797706 RepID=A0A1F5FVJ7_9BACT|nr:MAG: hypothetical protein A2165_03060 [Candidatus Curtissbacteria bacterium RBG_13_40_7]
MHERVELLQQLKTEILIGNGIKYLHGLIAVTSAAAIASSVPLHVLNVLPQWVELAMSIGGALNLPGSIRGINAAREWLADAHQKQKILESQIIRA